jgi:hypothetical protein
VGCDPFRPALLVFHACNVLLASSQAFHVRCPALLALFALVQISSIALLMVLHVLLLYALHMCCPALLVLPAPFQPGKVERNFPRPLNVSPTPPIHHQLLAIFDVVLHPLLTHGTTSQRVQDGSAMSHHAGATLSVTHTPDYCQLFPGPVRGRFHKRGFDLRIGLICVRLGDEVLRLCRCDEENCSPLCLAEKVQEAQEVLGSTYEARKGEAHEVP